MASNDRQTVWCDARDQWITVDSHDVRHESSDAPRPAAPGKGKFAIKCGHSFASLVGVGSAAILTGAATSATLFDTEDDVLAAFDAVVAYLKRDKLTIAQARTIKFDIVEL